MNRKKWSVLAIILIILLVIGTVFLLVTRESQDDIIKKQELNRFFDGEYQGAFLGMYGIDTYDEGDFSYYRGIHIMRASYEFKDEKEMSNYIIKLLKKSPQVDRMYIGLDPEKMEWFEGEKKGVLSLIQSHPEITFEVLLAYPSLQHWLDMTPTEMTTSLEHYRQVITTLSAMGHVKTYYFGFEEWLIGNQSNYDETGVSTIQEVSRTILLKILFETIEFNQHPYCINSENMEERLGRLTSLIELKREKPSLQLNETNASIVFFGDSIIANYPGSLSIYGVVGNFSKAQVFNCGLGGGSATYNPENETHFPKIVEAMTSGNLEILPKDTQAYKGLNEFQNRQKNKDEALWFIISYGLNDYFSGLPISSDDPKDIKTYEGALRTGISKLQESYPEAEIILMTPTFSINYNNGTEKASEQGGVLADYVEAVLNVAEEMSISSLNNFKDLGINKDNRGQYLVDDCHLNELGRLRLGENIIKKMETLLNK